MARLIEIEQIIPHKLIYELYGIEAWEDGLKNLTFNPLEEKGYCKYCYQEHNAWALSYAHINPMAWECLYCNHFTRDEFLGNDDGG